MAKVIRYEVEGYYRVRGQSGIPLNKQRREWGKWMDARDEEHARELLKLGMGRLGGKRHHAGSDTFSKLRIVKVKEKRKVIAGDVQ